MAKHFAKIGMNGKVIEVITLEDSVCQDSNDAHNEAVGQQYLQDITFWPAKMWVETFKDGTRKNYAGIGYTWDEDRNAFITPKTYSSWVLDETTCRYKAPVTEPTGDNLSYTKDGVSHKYKIHWDEANTKFTGERLQDDPITTWDWDPDTSTWSAQ